jgi:hypothetical protein
MSIQISGKITVQETSGALHHIDAEEFTIDEHLDGEGATFLFDPGDWRISIEVEEKNGAISAGNWEALDCVIKENTISFSIEL